MSRVVSAAVAACAFVAFAPAQTIARIRAPAIGRNMSIDYVSTAGNVYSMLLGTVPFTPFTIPGIGGVLQLPLATLVVGYTRAVGASGFDSVPVPVPNSPSLLGRPLGLQAIDFAPPSTLTFSTNAVELSFSDGIGTVVLAMGASTATTTGNLALQAVQNASAGAPVAQGVAAGVGQTIYHFGHDGFVQVAQIQTTSGIEMAELDIDNKLRVARSVHDNTMQFLSLPNGFDLYVMRDGARPKEFFLMVVDRTTGLATELTGSRTVDTSATVTPASNYQAQFALTADGSVAVAIKADTNNNPVNNQGVPDRVVLVKTDPTQLWSNGLNVIDVSPLPGPDALHTQYNGTVRICNGVGFVEGEEPSGISGEAALWGGPIDGSARWQRIPVPNTGTGNRFYWSYSLWRTSPDGRTDVFLNGGTAANIDTDMDVMAMRNISTSATPVVTNITRFSTPTQLARWGTASVGTTGNASNNQASLRAALAPDGARVAFVIGAGTVASPQQIAIVRTDGSDAGNVQSFTTNQFDAQIVQFAELWWSGNGRLLFAAGGAPITGTVPPTWDLYAYDLGSGVITPVTKTTTGSLVPPFTQGGSTGSLVIRASFMSRNGLFYYFSRHFASAGTPLTCDLVGVHLATLQVFDVTGNEFNNGSLPSLRQVFPNSFYGVLPRRAPSGEIYFVSPKDTGSAALFADEEVWKVDVELGLPAVQLTAFNGTGPTLDSIRRIGEFRLRQDGVMLAFTQGVGTAAATPEDVFVMPTAGGPVVKVSRSPTSGGQGVRRGSLHFTPTPFPGIVWSQGTNSRSTPTLGLVAYWNSLRGTTTPLPLAALPAATPSNLLILGAGIINP